jgi:hypothetical protein
MTLSMPQLLSSLNVTPLFGGTPAGAIDPSLPAGTEYDLKREIPCPNTDATVQCVEIEVSGWRFAAVKRALENALTQAGKHF